MIKTTEEAIKLLTEKRCFEVEDIKRYDWLVIDEEINDKMTNEQLIDYANEQKRELDKCCELCGSTDEPFDVCDKCGKVICHNCANWYEKQNKTFCKECDDLSLLDEVKEMINNEI